MNSTKTQESPKLASPGAGLPFAEWLIAKYFIIPKRFRSTSLEQAIFEFEDESRKITTLAGRLDAKALGERRLVPRLRGLEDSSRYWSVAMALQHLVIVGEGMLKIITALTSGKSDIPRRGTADVKPSPEVDPAAVISSFEAMSAKFVQVAEATNFDQNSQLQHPHPWFGPLTARQWLLFAAPHQSIHRKQIEEIIKRL